MPVWVDLKQIDGPFTEDKDMPTRKKRYNKTQQLALAVLWLYGMELPQDTESMDVMDESESEECQMDG